MQGSEKSMVLSLSALPACITEDADECNAQGMDAFFPIIPRAMTLEEAVDKENSKKNMAHMAEEVFRLIKAVRK